MEPYYSDAGVTLWLGDCLELLGWLAADVLVTDPPYGIGWRIGTHRKSGSVAHSGIANDQDTSARDKALALWGGRPAVVFGSFYAPAPKEMGFVLVYRKPSDSGLIGSSLGWRRDVEPIWLTGAWPKRAASRSALVETRAKISTLPKRTGHPHTKPVDVMLQLIDECPGGVIADPFAGSGSTLVAAKQLGRQAVGVEIDERYCEMAARRLSQGVLPLAV